MILAQSLSRPITTRGGIEVVAATAEMAGTGWIPLSSIKIGKFSRFKNSNALFIISSIFSRLAFKLFFGIPVSCRTTQKVRISV
jgi:hypothetical protein